MQKPYLYINASPALNFAKDHLEQWGFPVADSITDDVTHILLPIPTRELPKTAPAGCTWIGGNIPQGIDLLKDPFYLAQNAALTAHGALSIALNRLTGCIWEVPCLILGFGRIAQCLAGLLKALGVRVSIAARREEQLAMAQALGYDPLPLENLSCKGYRLIFNTVPAELGLKEEDFDPNAVKIDLASLPALPGADTIHTRGLPGKLLPESSGRLIAARVAYYLKKE